jgi:hypothetical protein
VTGGGKQTTPACHAEQSEASTQQHPYHKALARFTLASFTTQTL